MSFDLGPSQIAVAVARADGCWSGWVEPLGLNRQHRAGSPACFDRDGSHTTGRCGWRRSRDVRRTAMRVAELQRRLGGHRKTLHGALANRLLGHGAGVACEYLDYVLWQKNFPRSVRDRAPGLLVEMMRRKAAGAGGQQLYEYNPQTTALSQTPVRDEKEEAALPAVPPLRVSACLGLHVRTGADGVDRLDLPSATTGWLRRQDVDESPKSSRGASARKRRGRRHPPSRRSVARINARRKARAKMRQSRSARTSTTDQPTAIAA